MRCTWTELQRFSGRVMVRCEVCKTCLDIPESRLEATLQREPECGHRNNIAQHVRNRFMEKMSQNIPELVERMVLERHQDVEGMRPLGEISCLMEHLDRNKLWPGPTCSDTLQALATDLLYEDRWRKEWGTRPENGCFGCGYCKVPTLTEMSDEEVEARKGACAKCEHFRSLDELRVYCNLDTSTPDNPDCIKRALGIYPSRFLGQLTPCEPWRRLNASSSGTPGVAARDEGPSSASCSPERKGRGR